MKYFKDILSKLATNQRDKSMPPHIGVGEQKYVIHYEGQPMTEPKTYKQIVQDHGKVQDLERDPKLRILPHVPKSTPKPPPLPKQTKPMGKNQDIKIPKKEFVKEHKRLIHVLESPSHKDDVQEAKKQRKELKEDLRKWFAQKWVRMDTKGNIKGQCARDPGEGKPKCLPQAKAHSLGKEKRAAAARRKRAQDPNPERKGKAINVRTEDVGDPKAAVNADGLTNLQGQVSERKKQIIKSIYKKPSLREDLYDHEKEDKSVATYGKKPKFQKPGPDAETKQTPPAAAVLTGGKTMTGEPRDTIEIDPMMKMKKDILNSQNSDSQKSQKPN